MSIRTEYITMLNLFWHLMYNKRQINLPYIVLTHSKPWKSHNFIVISAEHDTVKTENNGYKD